MYHTNYAVLIPVYNEEKTIRKVILEMMAYHYPYIVVNDGSIDNTLDVIKNITDDYLTYKFNMGKGYAIKQGIKYLINKGYDWIIIVDSDGQSNIGDIIKVLKLRHLYPKAKILIGNRLNNPSNMPKNRLYINKFMSWVISLLIGQKVPDTQCGLKIIHKDVFNNINTKCNRFDYESELLIKAGKKGYKIVYDDVECIYFKGRKSKMHPIKDALRFIKLIIKSIMQL